MKNIRSAILVFALFFSTANASEQIPGVLVIGKTYEVIETLYGRFTVKILAMDPSGWIRVDVIEPERAAKRLDNSWINLQQITSIRHLK